MRHMFPGRLFYKFCPNLLNGGVDDDRAPAKQSLLRWPCPLPSDFGQGIRLLCPLGRWKPFSTVYSEIQVKKGQKGQISNFINVNKNGIYQMQLNTRSGRAARTTPSGKGRRM